jgi:hypothetical protein
MWCLNLSESNQKSASLESHFVTCLNPESNQRSAPLESHFVACSNPSESNERSAPLQGHFVASSRVRNTIFIAAHRMEHSILLNMSSLSYILNLYLPLYYDAQQVRSFVTLPIFYSEGRRIKSYRAADIRN